ncbi:CopG family ribbon-helix-helix protein [Paenibacillus sp. J2TS4]|uniref:CopG family ribbon-helix-helix protein n=1 Tax=Paenibacillus sp. J2TS4 TaxID=2807194 RepID=UPI001BD0F71B|nr:ribbon-helix-helix protein, CopG family [Paenibacillus sp. J2TS4]
MFGGASSVSSVNTKRIMISLPDQLLREVDGIVELEKSNRSELIRQAMKLYLMERKKRYLRESMQRGYMEMAKINLNIASEAFQAEEDAGSTLDRLVSGV